MSQENVESIRQGYEQWRETREFDFSRIDPDIEWVFIDMEGKPLSFHGHEGFGKWLDRVNESWEDIWWEPERLIDAGDQVAAIVTAHVRGRGSGIDLDVPLGNLWTIHQGMAVRFEMFLNPHDALEAAGLRE